MNTLALIKKQQLKAQSLQAAQKVLATVSEAKDYTSAHLSPAKLAQLAA